MVPPCRQYQEFRIGNDGALQGVGMLIASDPQSGRMVVLAPIKGSPADEAGIQPGDEVREQPWCGNTVRVRSRSAQLTTWTACEWRS